MSPIPPLAAPIPHLPPGEQSRPASLPDIARDAIAVVGGRLDRVGMAGIQIALRLRSPEGDLVLIPARATAQVSLDDPDVKAIHMSRLFLALQQELDRCELSLDLIDRLLRDFVQSHETISRSSHLGLQFEYMAKRSSLLSNHLTWRGYPVCVEGHLQQDRVQHQLRVSVAYSSTCPCSAALARQLLQQQFLEAFGDHRWMSVSQVVHWLGHQGTLATPHSQRSHAEVTVVLHERCRQFPFLRLIEAVETAVATPVQTVVKRRDEQEFARLNGENLMFCEDAARRIRAALEQEPDYIDYRIQARHLESLHPHDAVAIVTKGIPGGLQP